MCWLDLFHYLCNMEQILREMIERMVGRKMLVPRDFVWLSEKVLERTQQRVSASTLRRFWGYVNEGVTASIHDIGRLKVSVYYLLGVDVMHSIKQLEEDVFSLSLPTAPVFQRDTIYPFHYDTGTHFRYFFHAVG